jgi:hypothetical protein
MEEKISIPGIGEGLEPAQENLEAAEERFKKIAPLFIDKLLIVTGNKPEVVKEILEEIANVTGFAAGISHAELRLNWERNRTDPKHPSPHRTIPRQESSNYAQSAGEKILSTLQLVEERAELVEKGQSPIQLGK